MKKAFGQTVRDLKRGVNKKVLKVPSVEQKILDATSNEPWGPHGSALADIAQATRNYHEHQMIMSVIWKRINDTGKNWRHVFKALTVLEYLVAHGSERVIDEIMEHAYQISALADFQYIDSSGRDQGSNVRKKSQSLVMLVNDKEKIEEVRQKVASNRDKHNNTSMGGMNRPGVYGERYDDDRYEGRYGGRDDDHNGYGKEREWGPRDEDRYGKYEDSNSRDGDGYGRDSEEHYGGRDGYKDDYNHRDGDRPNEEDGNPVERKLSEPNIAPPSYEEVVGEARSPIQSESDGETPAASAPELSSPPLNTSDLQTSFSTTPAPTPASAPETKEFAGFDEFDPRGSVTAAPTSSSGAEMDFLGSLSESFPSSSLAIVSTTTGTTTLEAGAFTNSGFGNGFSSESMAPNQSFEDPFGDGPFRAISYTDGFPSQLPSVDSTSSFHSNPYHSEPPQPTTQNIDTFSNFRFGEIDILADILPPTGPSAMEFPSQTTQPASQTGFATQIGQPSLHTDFQGQINHATPIPGFQGQPVQTMQTNSHTGFATQTGQPSFHTDFQGQNSHARSLSGQPDQTMQQGQNSHARSLSGQPDQTMQPVGQTGFATQTEQLMLRKEVQGQNSHATPIPGFEGQPDQTMQPTSQTGFASHTGQPSFHTDFEGQNSHVRSISGFQGQLDQAMQPASQTGLATQAGQPSVHTDFQSQVNHARSVPGFHGQTNLASSIPGFQGQPDQSSLQTSFPFQIAQPSFTPGFAAEMGNAQHSGFNAANQAALPGTNFYGGFNQQSGSTIPAVHPTGPSAQYNSTNFLQQAASPPMAPQLQHTGFSSAMTSVPTPPVSSDFLALVPQSVKEKKFETKSTVWADTLNRGLVNLNISGSKTNPNADIGVDFDAINRKEKRMEKPSQTPVVSTITMGKAMGSGSGIGRAGAGAIRGAPNPMVGSGLHMGMSGAPGAGMGIGMGMGGPPGGGMGMVGARVPGMGMGAGYGMNQPMGGMGMGMNMGMTAEMNMGMGAEMHMGMGGRMNMGMGQGVQMPQQPTGFPPGSTMPGGYNPMMGTGYMSQPYNGAYR